MSIWNIISVSFLSFLSFHLYLFYPFVLPIFIDPLSFLYKIPRVLLKVYNSIKKDCVDEKEDLYLFSIFSILSYLFYLLLLLLFYCSSNFFMQNTMRFHRKLFLFTWDCVGGNEYSSGFVMAIREFSISGVLGVVHTPPSIPNRAGAVRLTFRLYIFILCFFALF